MSVPRSVRNIVGFPPLSAALLLSVASLALFLLDSGDNQLDRYATAAAWTSIGFASLYAAIGAVALIVRPELEITGHSAWLAAVLSVIISVGGLAYFDATAKVFQFVMKESPSPIGPLPQIDEDGDDDVILRR